MSKDNLAKYRMGKAREILEDAETQLKMARKFFQEAEKWLGK